MSCIHRAWPLRAGFGQWERVQILPARNGTLSRLSAEPNAQGSMARQSAWTEKEIRSSRTSSFRATNPASMLLTCVRAAARSCVLCRSANPSTGCEGWFHGKASAYRHSDRVEGQRERWFQLAGKRDLEGIAAKRNVCASASDQLLEAP